MNNRGKTRLLKLSKIDAARRQIESAIWLWFLDADIVSVHTLTAAAHRILLELSKHRGVTQFPCITEDPPVTQAKGTKRAFRDAETYFKHAKNAETYELNEVWTELYLFDAVMTYTNLFDSESGNALMSTFVVKFAVHRPDLFAPNAFPFLERKVDHMFCIDRLEKLSKIEFLKEFFGFFGRPVN